jgi:isoquinoline 1-oxidoreductase beta subunit
MPIVWDAGPAATLSSEAIRDDLYAGLEAQPELTLRDDGDVEPALAAAATRLEAEYYVPYLEHATLEPMTCTALVTDERFEVWAPTQVPETAISIAAQAAEMDVSAGDLHSTLMGGGFGRRQMSDYVRQAVEIAKAMRGTPIKLLWSREDTTQNGFYRPPSVSRVRAGLDAGGHLTAWWHRVVSHARDPVQSTFGADSLLYAVPHMRVDQVVRDPYLPAAPMRGVGYAMNCFVTQSAVDELAVAAGVDTYSFQRALLDPAKAHDYVPPSAFPDFDGIDPATRAARLRAVLDEAARRSGWTRPLRPGGGRGIAVNEEASSYFAAVAEVTLDGEGWFRVDRVVVAGDPGFLVSPDAATAQVEGSVAFALTSAMYGEITIRDGAVVESNFHDYLMLRIDEMPQVEVHWAPNRDVWGGIGEPAASVVIPAVTNAIYDAGGPRIRVLPLKNHRIERRG